MTAEAYYTDLLNVYIKHYNEHNNTTYNLFQNIENDGDTNDIMEEFYEHMNDFKKSLEYDKKLYTQESINVDEFDTLFGLEINGRIVCVCKILFPILMYIVSDIRWTEVNWKIIPLKYNE